jgi:hypothetical protein
MADTQKQVTLNDIYALMLAMSARQAAMEKDIAALKEAGHIEPEIPNAETQEIILKTDEAIAAGNVKHITSLEQYIACAGDDDDTVYSFADAELSIACMHYDAEHMEV